MLVTGDVLTYIRSYSQPTDSCIPCETPLTGPFVTTLSTLQKVNINGKAFHLAAQAQQCKLLSLSCKRVFVLCLQVSSALGILNCCTVLVQVMLLLIASNISLLQLVELRPTDKAPTCSTELLINLHSVCVGA